MVPEKGCLMLDHFTGENVDVRTDREVGPYIMIEPAKIARVEQALRQQDIPFLIEEGSGADIGTPEAAVIEFRRDADVHHIQRVLDSIQ